MANLLTLRKYAQKVPESLPNSVLFQHSSKNITIFDAFPKSIFHFLVLPRVQQPGLDAKTLGSLDSLLNADKEQAKGVISSLAEDAQAVKKEIESEMIKRYGFKWDVWIGFHGAPSMVHLHLHVLSADLCSEKMKNKKHYNSFHPKLGFFLHIDGILELFDATPTYFTNMVKQLNPKLYEPLLKAPLTCFHCEEEMRNVPTLKEHLEEEWDKLAHRAKESGKRKRKVRDGQPSTLQTEYIPEVEQGSSKRAKSEADDVQ